MQNNLRDTVKKIPVIGYCSIMIYRAVYISARWIKHTLLRKEISKLRWNKIKRELMKRYGNTRDYELRELIENIRTTNEIRTFNYPFVNKYSFPINVYQDEMNGYRFVRHLCIEGGERKIYFPLEWNVEEIQRAYRNLLIEQDKDSPHCYLKHGFEVPEGAVVLDCGAAEGNFSISIIEKVKHVYLFECEDEWKKPLELTFAPWKDKISIIKKLVSDVDDGEKVTLDAFINKEKICDENLYIKMDIEGDEEKGLRGLGKMMSDAKKMQLVICAYHTQESEQNIRGIFANYPEYYIASSKGYMILNNFCDKIKFPYIRRGLLFAKKISSD